MKKTPSIFLTMRQLRHIPVRMLTPNECTKLLVHHHGGTLSDARRTAYLLRAEGDNWPRYFTPARRNTILQWIKDEPENDTK